MHQRSGIEASTSYHSLPKDYKDFDNEVALDLLNQLQVKQDLKSTFHSKDSRRSTIENSPTVNPEDNNVQVLNVTNDGSFRNEGDEVNEGRKNLYAGGDLDLHACKSYVVDLIDRALSKQLGTQTGEKKVHSIIQDNSRLIKDLYHKYRAESNFSLVCGYNMSRSART